MKTLFSVMVVILFFCACNDADDTTPAPITSWLSAEVLPTADKGWYKPDVNTTWQWQLLGTVNTSYNVAMYDVDLFDTSSATIADLKATGKKVICYFSAGSYEDWRDDAADFVVSTLGNTLDGWADEKWLDIRIQSVARIMQARLDLAVAKGCDGVEPDNMDGYTNDTGFPLSATDQLAYNRFIFNEAHDRNLSVGLKNSGDQALELVDYVDFELNEECHFYNECAQLAIFTTNNKPIFNAEYDISNTDLATLCSDALSENIRTLVLPIDLDDSFRNSCD